MSANEGGFVSSVSFVSGAEEYHARWVATPEEAETFRPTFPPDLQRAFPDARQVAWGVVRWDAEPFGKVQRDGPLLFRRSLTETVFAHDPLPWPHPEVTR